MVTGTIEVSLSNKECTISGKALFSSIDDVSVWLAAVGLFDEQILSLFISGRTCIGDIYVTYKDLGNNISGEK